MIKLKLQNHLDPDPPKNVRAMHNGTDNALVSWTSPGCNGGAVRSVRVKLRASGSSDSALFETNQTNWDNETNDGYAIIDNYDFIVNVEYSWNVTVQYNYRDGWTWSQESETYSSVISGK